jgi:hypothetical protein
MTIHILDSILRAYPHLVAVFMAVFVTSFPDNILREIEKQNGKEELKNKMEI